MGFDRESDRRLVRLSSAFLLFILGAGCSAPEEPRYALRPPVTRDQDLEPVTAVCRKPTKKGEPDCGPEMYESSFAWDGADNIVFRPISEFFQVRPGGEAVNVNALDEAPDSSWFTSRIGAKELTSQEITDGPCKPGPILDPNDADGSWVIDAGKDNGANPGFRVKVKGTKFMLKTDSDVPERATGATAISTRFYWAAGWFAPCDSVVYFKRSLLKLTPGLKVKANTGPAKDFDNTMLDATLQHASRRGELYRVATSRWLPGKAVGPFTYGGRREDDPNDVIPHEDRRDLRGARVIAAWLNHFDSREQNSMDTWLTEEGKPSRGHVQHWYIDIGDPFGSEWTLDGISRRLGRSYIFDFDDVGYDFITLGIPRRPWDRATRTPGAENFGYFSANDFDPDGWKGEYPSPAFGRMTERDGAWATRIIARFTDENVRAAVSVGDFTSQFQSEWLTRVLLSRQRSLMKRYFSKLSPVTDVSAQDHTICGVDLARKRDTFDTFSYHASYRALGDKLMPVPVEVTSAGRVCVTLPASTLGNDVPPNDRRRYRIVRLWNGAAPGPLEVHSYDRGAAGLAVAGLERPPS